MNTGTMQDGSEGWVATGPWKDAGRERIGNGSLLLQDVLRPVRRSGTQKTGTEHSVRDVVTLATSQDEAYGARGRPKDSDPVDADAVLED